MDSDLTLDFIIIVVLIIANGLFSMTELAIVNAKNVNSKKWQRQAMSVLKAFELAENQIICFLLFKSVLPSLVF